MDFDFLNELNENQRAAVEYTDGASLVIAGAGSGKTRVLTYKIAFLLKLGIHPVSILALTFTNKAAREMKERIAQLVGEKTARYLWMGTFHAIFSRILRVEAEKLGYTKNFSIYDTHDSQSLLKTIVKEMKLDDKVYKASALHSRISNAKNNLISPKMYAADGELCKNDRIIKIPDFAQIYATYCARLRSADAMDFDDLLMQTNILFRDHPDTLAKYQEAFKFILVDEYQDTNFAQYLIIKKLAEKHEHICVVGDDAQSIYSFRGANIDNILKFKDAYRSTKIFKLEQNYRSTQTIVNAANSLIDKNENQIPKKVFSENPKGEQIIVNTAFTDIEEGSIIANKIVEFSEKYEYGQIAILYRTNAQSRVIEDALRKKAIPYRIWGGLSFYQRKEIKDVIAYCRLVSNHHDHEALQRIINVPARGIGDTTLAKLADAATAQSSTVWDILLDLPRYNLPINAGTTQKLSAFKEMILNFSEKIETLSAYKLLAEIVKTSGIIADTYSDKSPESQSKRENVEELLTAVHQFCETREKDNQTTSLPEFLAEVSLLTDQDTDKDDKTPKVTLMTIHAAKGLEFKVVFIAGLEENLFPSSFCNTPREIEEERRLLYVAITRAEEQCVISYAKSRFRNGTTSFCNPSRFLENIDEKYLDRESIGENSSEFFRKNDFWMDNNRFVPKESLPQNNYSKKRLSEITPDKTSNPNQNSTYADATTVKHSIFGIGKVVETNFEAGNEKVIVDFGAKGTKTLLTKFAKLEVIV
ncbi:MAG: UvrD-helicase domain-containing protein [Paludibacter sp.]|jgi:DNA helicase-2/ATP-dependent DNA helicase PcrA|nr:UvrD-helicase domain-containing protein [Paludibacter sp.]